MSDCKVITNSMAGCFRSCARKCKFRYVDMRRPHTKSSPLYMGQLIHEALEKWLPSHDGSLAQAHLEAAEIEDEYTRAKLMAMMHGYHVAYRDDGVEAVEIEKQFDIPLVNPATGRASRTWRVGGKVDAIVKWKDKLWVMEHKTSSQDIEPGSTYWQRLRLDSQVSTYFMAAKEMGYDVEGILYDVLWKPNKRPLMATPEDKRKYLKDGRLHTSQREDDEQPVAYMARIMTDCAANPKRYYQRGIVLRGEVEQEEAAFDLWQTASMIHNSTKAGRWPRNPGNCFFFNSQCDYFDVCTGIASIDDNLRFRTADSEHEEL